MMAHAIGLKSNLPSEYRDSDRKKQAIKCERTNSNMIKYKPKTLKHILIRPRHIRYIRYMGESFQDFAEFMILID